MRTKRILLMCVVMSLVLLMPVFGEGQQEGGTTGVSETEIKIGTTIALSGPVAGIGGPYAEGMEAYFAHVNKTGGIHGRQVKLSVADDQFNPANTNFLTRRLVERDGVFAMVGSLGTPCVLAVMDYLNSRGIPFVYQGSGATKLAVPPKKYVFPFQPNYLLEGNIMVQYMVEELGYTRLAMVYRNADDGKDAYESAKATIASYDGVEMVDAISVDPGANDFSAAIRRLQNADVEGVMLLTFSPQTEGFMTQANDFGLDATFLASYANADPSIIARVGADKMEGFLTMAWVFADLTDPTYEPWTWYADYTGEEGAIPNAFAVAGMIAAELFTEAARRVGPELSREALVVALESMGGWEGELVTDVGYKTYDPNDVTCRLGKGSMYVIGVVDGEMQPVSDFIAYKDVQ